MSRTRRREGARGGAALSALKAKLFTCYLPSSVHFIDAHGVHTCDISVDGIQRVY